MLKWSDDDGDMSREGDKEGKRWRVRVSQACSAVTHVLTTPYRDCRHRSHPRVVPDYSLLVLVSCVANPLLGALVCCLHRHAKNLFHKGQKSRADMIFMLVLALALIAIGSNLLSVSLVASYHLIRHFSYVNAGSHKPARVCLFRYYDDQRMKELNLSRSEYCRRRLALKGDSGQRFTNSTKIIDLLGAWIQKYHEAQKIAAQ